MRLIDADVLYKDVYRMIINLGYAHDRDVLEAIEFADTAYDVEKVVEAVQGIPIKSAETKARIIRAIRNGGTTYENQFDK